MDIIVTKTGASGKAPDEMTDIAKGLATPTDFKQWAVLLVSLAPVC